MSVRIKSASNRKKWDKYRKRKLYVLLHIIFAILLISIPEIFGFSDQNKEIAHNILGYSIAIPIIIGASIIVIKGES